MKKFVLLPLVWLLVCACPLSAKVIRVNNQEPTKADQFTFDNLQDAYNNAVSGDSLYIEGSDVSYGSLDIAKRLIFIGSGFFLSENEGLSANNQPSVIRRFTFENGSSGSIVIGLSFTDPNTSSSGITLISNSIEILQCYFTKVTPISLAASSIEGIVIQGCFFETNQASSVFFNTSSSHRSPKDLLFTNNIVENSLLLRDNATGIISNNVFTGNTFDVGVNSNLQIHNNILLGTTTNNIVLPGGTGTNISHNISVVAQFPETNNNQPNVASADIFVTGTTTKDNKYRIREGGPADGTGRNGADIGPFGGIRPYKLSGLPGIPVVYDFSTDGYGNADGKLPVTVKVKAN